MERSFKVKTFERWMRKAGLTDAMLRVAVEEMSRGLIDASLGGHLVKKRVARTGFGKRGGYRTIVAKKVDQHWFFLFGFEKSERSNIDQVELRVLQEIGETLLAFTEAELNDALQSGELLEIMDGNQKN
ncbi:MAG: type II toxin-antitoxin system RelE/ParE family toxin [Betaproteobacteria bacterium]|nr:type II toxin-antitoxin system RelE/ParE family toxin [Betaproteobacteria bacterium]